MKDYRDDYLSAAISASASRPGADHVLAFLVTLYSQIGAAPNAYGPNPYDQMAAEITRAYTLNRAEASA